MQWGTYGGVRVQNVIKKILHQQEIWFTHLESEILIQKQGAARFP